MAREQDYITEARTAARKIWDGVNELLTLQKEWNAKAYGDTLPDGAGANAPVTKAEIGAAVFDTANTIEAAIQGGHRTNLARLL